MMSTVCWCLIFVTIPLVMCEQHFSTITIDQVIDSLTRALKFFSMNVDQVNLDAGIGTRMAADQLSHYTMCKKCKSVKRLVDFTEYVTWKIGRSVRARQRNYYDELSFLLMPGIFSTVQPFKLRTNKHVTKKKLTCSSSPFIEKYSDQCLHALATGKCNQTDICNKLLSDSHACRYSLTHQILYSIIAKHSSCYDHRLSHVNEYEMVSKMLNEAHAIAKANFLENDRDLFMEQIAFGGLLGWQEFFHENSWFTNIVQWQHPIEGCYGNDTNYKEKREELQMSHNCLSHRTSVAIAALSQILRYMLSRDI